MVLICEKCRRIIMEDVCPVCGSTETRNRPMMTALS